MNQHIVPEFEMEEDGSIPWAEEEELVELLWQNGQVVMQNQTRRPLKKPLLPPPKFHLEDDPSLLHHVLPYKPPTAAAGDVEPSTAPEQQLYIHEDEMASWLQYPLDDAADFCSDLLYSQSTPAASAAGRCPGVKPPAAKPPPIPPPRRPPEDEPDKAAANFAMFSRLKGKAAAQVQSASKKMGGMESTVVGSSVTPAEPRPARVAAGNRAVRSERHGGGTCDPTVTSSSGGFGASAGDQTSKPPVSDNRKRKARKGGEVVGLSEDAEYDYVEKKKAARGSNSTRRTRAAEVHNLSERRRRDRINEKMKDLQELIPHCNKSDKASMLDEAIEYLKSLQLQVQMMSMGFGMAPMVFPGIQHYMSPMGMGMGMRMGMGMGMGMGVGMNMDMSASSLNRPMLPFPPVLPPTPAQGSAPHMGNRLPIPPYQMKHIPLSDQPRAPTGQTDPAFNLVGLQIPSAQPHMHVADPYQQYFSLHHISMPPQGQAAAPPASTCNETVTDDGNKPG